MLKRGVYLPPSAFESWFMSNALTQKDMDITIDAAADSLKEIL
jgi:glutamate-1-semialdehyde 2,1-aminomutase